tara:strand:+ start:241 stop:423 length:183 start_codon:yes stop_codon:yes gene_type:complete
MKEKTVQIRIETSIYLLLKEHLKGKVPFKSASSFIGELILNALKTDVQISTGEKEDEQWV